TESTSTTTLPTTTTMQTTTQYTTIPIPNGSVVDHDPISISDDDEFATQVDSEDWPGSGSESSPYIIEGLRIEGSQVSISIVHCTVFFIIRDCVLLPDHVATCGINLWDSDNALVENCYIVADAGVDFLESINCKAIGCIIYGDWVGINASYSENIIVEYNQVYNCHYGIWVDNSHDVVVRGNELEYNDYAIEISASSSSACFSNDIQLNENGIHLMEFSWSNPTTNWTIWDNDVQHNSQIGIFLDEDTSNNLIYQNKIGSNAVSNAQDDGEMNSWDNGDGTGNSWSDYNGTGVYDIPGAAESIDHYPSLLGDPAPTFHDAIEINGDSDFATQAAENDWPGDGSEGTPYIIEGLTIEAEFCIRILHVTVHFEIRDCILKSTSPLWGGGVDLVYTDNGRIDNCIFYDSIWGLNFFGTEGCTVFNCSFYGNEFALNVSDSTFTKIELNRIHNNSVAMLAINDDYLEIRDNNIFSNEYSVDIWDSSHSYFGFNEITENMYGLRISGLSENWTVVHNDILYNTEIGISIGSSSSGSYLYQNNIGWNGASNAQDDGSSNTWDDALSTGNLWSDYGGSGTYAIPGSAESVDNYPSLLES
ncbi:MAG: NosD domain-containing protein, partial [Candidatus Thorarchaeota archaeon]